MTAAIYPGSFDPLTNGHVDIIERGLRVFDRLIVAIADNPQKSHTFALKERIELTQKCIKHLSGVEVDTFDGLLIDYARKKKVHTILRGLRAFSDFEYEFQLAAMNHQLCSEIDTVFMMTGEEHYYVSSRLIREVSSFGADVRKMVPKPVHDALVRLNGKKAP